MSHHEQAAAISGIVVVGLASIQIGRSPLALIHSAILHLRASARWIHAEAIPAIRVAASRYVRRDT